ncbi:MAG: hypothetical protein AMJ79_00525 [Phycisphaerae bacterium SM23_30]|nr:MAG: hypothetical protein AMJ79_00525 [Phycisphaerae bacterium SM23_30]
MKRTNRRNLGKAAVRLGGILSLAVLAAVFGRLVLASDYAVDPQQRARAPSKIMVGEIAPDFVLPTLTFDTDAAGKPIGIISDKNVIRLSSFFGKKPVCMIMSSYT